MAHPRAGKLSIDTQISLTHTTRTLILVIKHLLEELKFHYVLLGKFQTDQLEARFGKLRKKNGNNFFISVQDLYESEKKIKINNLLRLRSGSRGDINLELGEDILLDCNFLEHANPEFDNLDIVDAVIDKSFNVDIDENSLQVLIYISGYASKKAAGMVNCDHCHGILLTDQNLEVEISEDMSYINDLNRGGLKFPTEYSINIGIAAYQIFQILISEDFEAIFLTLENQKAFLFKFICDRCDSDFIQNNCSCSFSIKKLNYKLVTVWCNVLLNNYSKQKNDQIQRSKGTKRSNNSYKNVTTRRKLQTLDKI